MKLDLSSAKESVFNPGAVVMRIIAQTRLITKFLTPIYMWTVILGLCVGLVGALNEIFFAFVLLRFLSAFGVVPAAVGGGLLARLSLTRRSALLLLFVVGVSRGLLQWAQSYLISKGLLEFLQIQRARILRLTIRGSTVDSSRALSIFGEYSSHSGTVVMNIQAILIQAAIFLCLGISLLRLAPHTTLTLFAAMIGASFIFRRVLRWLPGQDRSLYKIWEEVFKRFLLAIKNFLLIQIHGMQEVEEKLAISSLDKHHKAYLRTYNWTSFRGALPQMLGVTGVCAIIPFLDHFDLVEPSLVLTYLYLFFRATQCVGLVTQQASGVRDHWEAFRRLFEWWIETLPEAEALDQGEKNLSRISMTEQAPFGWSLKSVDFSYPLSRKRILNAFDLDLEPAKFSVIMGESGRGKTTLLGIMLGTLSPQKGTVHLSSGSQTVSVGHVKSDFLDHIGYVGPENFIFNGTIYDNLVYGLKWEPAPSEIESALTISDCEFISKLDKGLKHPLSDQGQGLSAGQKQRLALARALLRKPWALILDEGTSNLDRDTEERILARLQTLKGQISIIAVTHRDSYLKVADRVIHI